MNGTCGTDEKIFILQRFRLMRGITQEEMADELVRLAADDGVDIKVNASMISKWECGHKRPRKYYRRLLCRFYQATEEDLGFRASAVDRNLAKLCHMVPGGPALGTDRWNVNQIFQLAIQEEVMTLQRLAENDIVNRRDVLATMAVATGTLLLGPIKQLVGSLPHDAEDVRLRRVGMDEVAHFEELVEAFSKWGSQSGSQMRMAVLGQVRLLGKLLENTPSGSVKNRLFEVAAQMAQRAGCMSYDSRMYGVAQRYYLSALRFCREANNHLIAAKILSDMSYIATAMGNHKESLELIDAAISALPARRQGIVRAELLGRQASARALLGYSLDAKRSVEESLRVNANSMDESLPPVFNYLTSSEIYGLASTTYLDLAKRDLFRGSASGYALHAEKYALAAIRGRDENFTRSRAVDTIRLMNIRLLNREPDEAIRLGNSVMDFAREVRSSRVSDRLVQFHRDIKTAHRGLSGIEAFEDVLRSHLVRSGERKEIGLA
jgi:transcriptional regulator with XRE-family HTH domain